LQSAKVFLKISELAKIKTKQAIREATISAYGNVLLSDESITILENNLTILNKNVHDTQQLINEGFAEEQDVEQLKITRSNLKNQLNRAKRLLIISKKVLKLTIGMDIEKPITLSDTLEILVAKNTDLEIYNFAFELDNHIDYKIAQNSVKASELLMKFEKSKALPSLSTFINYGVDANNNTFNFTSSKQKWFGTSLLGVSLNVPIFSSFQRRSKTQQAKIALDQAKIDLTETEQKLKLEVATAKTNYQYAIDNYQTTKENLALAKRIEHKEQIKYAEGIGSSFNLATAQNQLHTTQQSYLQTIVEIINTKVKLENALNQ
jgi:outer membrane protein TolC